MEWFRKESHRRHVVVVVSRWRGTNVTFPYDILSQG